MAQSAGAENMKGAEKVHVPPIKTQGIKTKLVPWIARCDPSAAWTVWVEPFMGSGVVGFNLAPRRALFSDTTDSSPPPAVGSSLNPKAHA